MSQPPAPGQGQGQEPAPDPRLPAGPDSAAGHHPDPRPADPRHPDRPLRLEDFSTGGPGDSCLPGPGLAAALDQLSGPDQRCAQASDDELIGLLGRWAALESWASAGKLGVIRELLRRRAGHTRNPGPAAPGDLPRAWDECTGHEVSAQLRLSLPGADKLIDLAWTLRARLPGRSEEHTSELQS